MPKLNDESIHVIEPADLQGVLGGTKQSTATKKQGDNGRASFMKIWHQIFEQQSGGYR